MSYIALFSHEKSSLSMLVLKFFNFKLCSAGIELRREGGREGERGKEGGREGERERGKEGERKGGRNEKKHMQLLGIYYSIFFSCTYSISIECRRKCRKFETQKIVMHMFILAYISTCPEWCLCIYTLEITYIHTSILLQLLF